jgi:hypothetical protein
MSVQRIAACLLFLAGCTHYNSQMLPGPKPPGWGTPEWHAFIGWMHDSLAAADPERDAQQAVARGDLHLLGVLSEAGAEVPGLKNWTKYKPGIYLLPATGDLIEGADHLEYIRVAHAYARQYNKTVLASGVDRR